MKVSLVVIFAKVLVSFGLIFYLITIINWRDIRELSPATALLVALGSINTFLVLFFMVWRWALLILSQNGHAVALKVAYRGYLIGSFYNMLTPGAIGGDVARVKYSRDHFGIDMKQAAMIVVTERLTGAVAQFFILLVGLGIGGGALLKGHLNLAEVILACLVCATIFILFLFLKKKLLFPARTAGQVFILSLLAQGIDLFFSTIFLFVLWPDAKFYWLLIVMPLSFFVTVLPVSFSGLGIRESVMVGLLRLFHVDASIAVIFSLMLYFSKVPVALTGGLLLFFSIHKKQP